MSFDGFQSWQNSEFCELLVVFYSEALYAFLKKKRNRSLGYDIWETAETLSNNC